MAIDLREHGSEDDLMVDINTTPLIDVMLVLLVTLIVSLPIMTHAVKLDMPQTNQPPPPPDQRPEVIDLEIDFDGTVVWNGTVVQSVSQLAHTTIAAAYGSPLSRGRHAPVKLST